MMQSRRRRCHVTRGLSALRLLGGGVDASSRRRETAIAEGAALVCSHLAGVQLVAYLPVIPQCEQTAAGTVKAFTSSPASFKRTPRRMPKRA
mmetsp:Transcript_16500/g.40549  ORF Transcript_16500/g.40549 Transcript_16500/m.40549 type:complete len:92 (-) Transcript_16500:748-1023(-)